MKRLSVALLACLLALPLLPVVGMATDSEEEGPLVITFPEDGDIAPGKEFETYIISWEPLEDVHQYWFGAYINSVLNGASMWQIVGGGWMGSGYVQDGSGENYSVSNVQFDAQLPKIDGDVSEVDLADAVNEFCSMIEDPMDAEKSSGCYINVLIIPKSGEPIVQTIELPPVIEE